MKKNKHIGSSLDDLLKEEGIFEETQAQAIKEVIAWQLAQAMEKKHISKSTMATRLKTSRTIRSQKHTHEQPHRAGSFLLVSRPNCCPTRLYKKDQYDTGRRLGTSP